MVLEMRTNQRSKQDLNSSAYLSYIDVFYPSLCELTEHNAQIIARFTPFKYTDTALQFSEVEDGVIRKFPIIIRGDVDFP